MDKLVVDDIVKVIKKKTILDHVDLRVEPGQVLGIIGQNGAGKSTLLKIICGLARPTSGDVTLNDISIISEPNLVMDKIGFLIENPSLYPYLTGRQQLNYCIELRSTPSKDYIDTIIKMLDLESFLDKKTGQYSSGMKQRLGIACAVIHNPSTIILDEPTNSLDITGIKEIREFIKYMRHEGKTVLLSSHMLAEVESVCDQIVIIDKGVIIDSSELDTINQHYENICEIILENSETLINFLEIQYEDSMFEINGDYIVLGVKEKNLSPTLKNILNNGFELIGVQKEGRILEEYYLRKVEKETNV